MGPTEVLNLGLIPGATAFGMLLLAAMLFGRAEGEDLRPRGWRVAGVLGVIGCAAAYVWADYSINRWAGWWPGNATLRFMHVAAASAVVLMLAALVRWKAVGVVCAGALAGAGAFAVTSTLHPRFVSTAAFAWQLPMVAAFGALAAWSIPARGRGFAGVAGLVPMLVGVMVAGPVLFLSKQASMAQQTGPLVAACGACMAVLVFRRKVFVPLAGMGVVGVMLMTLLYAGYFHTDKPVHWAAFVMVALTASAGVWALVPVGAKSARWVVPIVVSTMLGGGAVLVAVLTAAAESEYPY